MDHGVGIQGRSRRGLFLAGALVLAAVALLPLAVARTEAFFIQQSAQRADATLRLAAEGLTGAIDRFRPLPSLIAERPLLARALREPKNEGIVPYLNEQLRQTAFSIGASDVYLMDIGGTVIAASNYRKTNTFIGQNFAYRPYFTVALDGGTGHFAALGTTSGERGYFIAAPVLEDTRITGVIAVKFTVEAFEEAWRAGTSEIIVSDLNTVVFMSSREDWHFRYLAPLTPQARDWITRTRQYPTDRLTPLPATRTTGEGGHDILTVGDEGEATEYLAQSTRVPEAGWTVSILTPTAIAWRQTLLFLAIGAGLVLLAGLVTAIILQRRAQLRERLNAQAEARALAESEVAKRTAELNTANTQLRREVEERRSAETRLRKTQADLVQAGKLAALGQMSAALSHEINQPLAAVKSYTDNAISFLDRDRIDEVRTNLGRISDMADRMSAISRHLRNFARRPQERLGPVPLLSVVDDAVALMSGRIRNAGAELRFDRPEAEIFVRGGVVRLQQVVVNLISNALDAMGEMPAPVVEITVEARPDTIALLVRDSGPGIDEDTLASIFDPFFTTKATGGGLGLGLSISYNIIKDFGGTLSAENRVGGGAEFCISLLPASSASEVAAQ
ncbi:sensor histidine kinase [Ovoidimarina sediminis]|uniref:sensor histidine kinase n=1 Tax=Ovoidimarina sediminis TaxID=3079856 RepID=UPI00290F58ED|nr:ATP-binding protein [Rhodophyticola sp. MJ-SS7]MDU8942239.1 ATP-binding protein [Rhodophyticola sp. MJ-SS7]